MGPDKQRIFGLDVVRAAAVLFVVFHHLCPLAAPPRWMAPFASLGSLGVELFFVLAGFLLGQTLLRMIHENRLSTGREVFRLFTKRWLRILPGYYFFFFISAAMFPPFLDRLTVHLQYLFFLQNFAWQMPAFYFQTWTLAILEFFYVFFTLALFLCYRLSHRTILSFVICLSLFCFIPLLLRATWVPLLGQADFEATIRRWVIYRLDAPVAGVLMALLSGEFPQAWKWLRSHAWIGLGLFAGSVGYHLAGFPLLYANHWVEILFYPATCASFALTLPLLAAWKENHSFFGVGISFISKLSYSIYVSHVAAILVVLEIFLLITGAKLQYYLVAYPVCLGSVLLVAWLSYRFVESPFLELRQIQPKIFISRGYDFSRTAITRLAHNLGLW